MGKLAEKVGENESVEMCADYLESEIKKQIYKIEKKKQDEYDAYEEKFKRENPDYESIPF